MLHHKVERIKKQAANYSDAYTRLGPASEGTLKERLRKTGKMYPGEDVCSRARWRIFLRKMAKKSYFEDMPDADTSVYQLGSVNMAG